MCIGRNLWSNPFSGFLRCGATYLCFYYKFYVYVYLYLYVYVYVYVHSHRI